MEARKACATKEQKSMTNPWDMPPIFGQASSSQGFEF